MATSKWVGHLHPVVEFAVERVGRRGGGAQAIQRRVEGVAAALKQRPRFRLAASGLFRQFLYRPKSSRRLIITAIKRANCTSLRVRLCYPF